MKKILKNGYMMSKADKLAIANDLLYDLEEWAMMGPKFMISLKPIKILLKKELKKLKESLKKEKRNLPANQSECIKEICNLKDFKPYKIKPSSMIKPNRKQSLTEKILIDGIELEDYEYIATTNYWEDPEKVVIDLLDNKIAKCKERFVNEWTQILLKDPSVKEIPLDDDDLIELVVKRPDYKNRKERESETDI
jgi:hypothetical protein